MKPKLVFSPRLERIALETYVPLIIFELARDKIITEKHLSDPPLLIRIFMKHKLRAIKKLQYSTAIEGKFLKHSIAFWRRGDQMIALVLYATAIEQYINSMFEFLLRLQGWKNQHTKEFIRNLSLDSKIDWAFEVVTKERFPASLRKRLRTVFSLRNSIVHYKSEPGRIDFEEDSFSKISGELRSLRRMSILRDFKLLEESFQSALLAADPCYSVAVDATSVVLGKFFEKSKK